jgi:hypothetical protein
MANLKSFARKIPKNVIYNKYVLYFVFFIALMSLYINAVKQDYMYCTIFILVGFIATFFNKNITVVLVIALIFATLLSSIISGKNMSLEGFEEKDGEDGMEKNGAEKNGSEEENGMNQAKPVTKKEKPTPSKLMDNLREHALDLQETQKDIINGFQKIEPYMDRAESLIESIQKTAENIKKLKNE